MLTLSYIPLVSYLVMHWPGTQAVQCLVLTKCLFQPSTQAHSSEIAFPWCYVLIILGHPLASNQSNNLPSAIIVIVGCSDNLT